jgi:peptidyl-prolyl cis-trans isomerase B (cyclophilin B)
MLQNHKIMSQKFYQLLAFTFMLSVGTAIGQSNSPAKKQIGAVKTAGKVASQKTAPGPVRIKISTDSGTIIIALSDSTPLHRDNFVKLVQQGFYDSLLFHRVIPQFMIQGGDPTSKNAQPGITLGGGGGDMVRIPAEFRPSLFHKKGALAAARDGNPEKASSACQFYIVEGKIYTDEQLNMLEQQKAPGFKYTPAQREMYKTVGGTPQLDQGYTVFGEVESGLEVIGKISHVVKDGMNRPAGDIRMRMEILK